MHEESFEDEKTAAILNEKFVPIKVDREERPDLDEIYMKAVTTLTGQGGWPLSVFLTPDLKPFYGGTYFPPVPRHGLPGFPEVLNFIADTWKTKTAGGRAELGGDHKGDQRGLRAQGRGDPLEGPAWTTRTRSSSRRTTRSSGGSAARPSSRSQATSGSSCATTPGPARAQPQPRHEDARLDGRRGDPRPPRRGVPQVLDRQVLARPPLREDALRQRAARQGVRRRLPRDPHEEVRRDREGHPRLDPRGDDLSRGRLLLRAGRGHPGGRGLLLHLDARRGLQDPREGGRRDLLRVLRGLAGRELRGGRSILNVTTTAEKAAASSG